jgi:tryptophanyl-tRNA synthetase
MSKSDADPLSRIELVDTQAEIELKIRKAVTDCESLVSYDPEKRPGVSTLVDIESGCTGQEAEECVENCLMRAEDTGEYKRHVASVLVKHLAPIRKEYERLMADRGHLRRVLDEGAEKAAVIAEKNYKEIRKIVGMS